MSSINGVCLFSQDATDIGEKLSLMNQAVSYCGLDGSRIWKDSLAGLGLQHLCISPESRNETHPRLGTENMCAISWDGRLDNRKEICSILGLANAAGLTDSELVIELYRDKGCIFLERLIGEFAFILWDNKAKKMLCMTDPMGIRPLYYFVQDNKYLLIASDVSAILAAISDNIQLNHKRIAMLGISLSSVYVNPIETCFIGIQKMPAASMLVTNGAHFSIREYWQPAELPRLKISSDEECAEAFREVFDRALESRLRSNHSIGALLSGGLDSSAIVGSSSPILNLAGKELFTISLKPQSTYLNQSDNENKYIDLFTDVENINMLTIQDFDGGAFDNAESLVKTGVLPAYSYQHYAYSAIAKIAQSNSIRLILDGSGGEFTASCYPAGYMAQLLLEGKWLRLFDEMRLASRTGFPNRSQIINQVLMPLFSERLKYLRRGNGVGLNASSIKYPIKAEYIGDHLDASKNELIEQIDNLFPIYPSQSKNMVNSLLVKRKDVRQNSHAGFIGYENISFSYPYWDKRVIEFALALDPKYFYHKRESRRLIRLSMKGRVDERIRNRTSKAPFVADYHLRSADQRDQARLIIEDLATISSVNSIVDFDAARIALKQPSRHDVKDSMTPDLDAQYVIPLAIYTGQFLKRFL